MALTPENLTVAALATWTVTALLGTNLLIRGGAYHLWRAVWRRLLPGRPRYRRLAWGRAVMVWLHIVLALSGLTLWLGYLFIDREELTYLGVGLLIAVSVIGFGVADRWRHAPGRHSLSGTGDIRFPIWSSIAHVMAGAATIVLVVLTLLADMHP
jgi:hypothetical protein